MAEADAWTHDQPYLAAHCFVCGHEYARETGYTVNPPGGRSTFFVCSTDWDKLQWQR